MVRAACIDKNGLKKGEWSKEEDQKLSAYVLRYGHWNWRLVPKYAGLNRCGKSCRLRWMNYLKPGVKRGNYSEQEGQLIKRLHDELGNRWSAIAARLPGRTDNEIKNYWHTHFDKRNRRKSRQQQQQQMRKAPQEKSSEINSTHWMNPTNSSEMVHSCLTQENSDEVCPNVYILDSSSGSTSNSGVSEGAADWDLGSIGEKNVGPEPSDSLGFSYGGSDDGATSSSDSFSGFQKSFVVDTSYIPEFDFSFFDDCGIYYSQVLGFENDIYDDVKLF